MFVVIAAAAVLASAPAAAQDDQRARLHFESGASYYEAGEYEDALREFQRAYELSQRPQLFYNLSLCYQNLGDLEQAASYLERYLGEVAEIENRANLEIRLGNLRERIAREATSASTEPATTTAVDPDPEATDPAATSEGPAAASVGGTATVTPAGADTAAGTASGGDALNVGAIAGFSVAAVGLVTAAIFGGLTVAEDSRLAGTACGMNATCTSDDLGTLRAYAVVTDVGLGVALAGAAVGLVFLIIGPGGSEDGERAALEVLPHAGPDGAGVSIGGSF